MKLGCILILLTAALSHGALAIHTGSSPASTSQRKIIGVSLMHRHGARTGPQVSPEGLTWGNAVLSPVGELMSLAMGGWLRGHYQQEYSNSSSVDNWPVGGIFCAPDPITGEVPLSTPFCIGRDYNTQQVLSQSTYFERTIRTAVGMLRGMFSNDSYGVPYVAHSPSTTDMKLGYYYTWPSALMNTDAIDNYNPSHDNQTLTIMSQAELDEIGAPLNSVDRCRTQQTLCILLAQDVTSCNYANTPQGPDSPTRIADALKKYWPRFRIAQQRSNAFLYLSNVPAQQPSSYSSNPANDYFLQAPELWERTGPFGRILTREIGNNFASMLDAFQSRQQGFHNGSLAPLLYHYSAHDVTQYGIQAAIGGITVEDMFAPDSNYSVNSTLYEEMTNYLVPQFASVLMFDLYDDGNISVSFASPPQVYGSNFSNYTITSSAIARMTCINEEGARYLASECPLEDFRRYVDYIKPEPSFVSVDLPPQTQQLYDGYDSYSYCYALPADIASTGCDPTSTAIPTDPNCILFRQVCPAFACNSPNYILNMTSWGCINNKAPDTSNTRYQMLFGSKRVGFFVGTVLGSLLLGIVIGISVRVACWERAHQRNKKSEEPLLVGDGNVNASGRSHDDYTSSAPRPGAAAPHTPTDGQGTAPYPTTSAAVRHNSGEVLGSAAPQSNALSPAASQMASIHTTPVHVQEKAHGDQPASTDEARPPLPIFSS